MSHSSPQPHSHPQPVPGPAAPPQPSANGHPHPSPSPSPAGKGRARRRRWPLFLGLSTGAVFLGVAGAGVAGLVKPNQLFPSLFAVKRPDLITHKVRPEYLQVTVVERGTLESAENRDVVCKVKAGSKGTFASTIRWVIDDGTLVSKGQLLMELDDSSLDDSRRTQSIAVDKAKALWITADENHIITVKQNEADIATAVAALQVAELDLDKFLGLRVDTTLNPLGSLAGGPTTIIERGEYRKNLDDVSGQLKLAEADLEAFRDRSSWAERSARLGYLTISQAKVEQSKMAAGLDNVEKLTKQKYVLETFQRQRDLTDLLSKVEVAKIGLDKAHRQAHAKEVSAESDRKTNYSVYLQELDKLRDIEDQIRECRIASPQDGMVVYYKADSGRFSQTQQGLIQVGEQVKEGQKLMRIPDLKRMQVNTKVHEALVSRIRGDDRQSTGFLDTLRAGLLLTPHGMTRLIDHSEFALNALREAHRHEEYYLASQGQKATIRVEAFPDRTMSGHVRTVAAVASQADFFSSDVKVYQTLVTIDEPIEGLKPDMSAEVTIHVDPPTEPVLAVPVQAVVGGTEGGSKRRVFVMTPGGPQEREVVLGAFNDKMVEVREGVAEGDDVVLNPRALLGDKAKTRDEPEAPTIRRGGPGGEKGKGGKGKGGKGGPGAGGGPAGPPQKQPQ